ncbi:branched-chain-amino-acid transaminase [Verrucomicrobia bacterium]|jgi:branched-chain amino acid aminotransferase|nr:branched-chain-amino-acid transaminase [Verrucomicrobiota bacterium]MDA7667740.1 branched-chain-amino-acid transaminase [bacterium]MDA7866433.1 branched-chain-amino-acid transaminase [Verrucomicrobiota bacterium]
MKIYIDGEFYDRENAKISVFDHGLLYGDGVFEGIRAYNGRIFKLREHIERLFKSAKAILLTIPMSVDEVCEAVRSTCEINELEDGYVRLIVTRGEGSLGLNPESCKRPSIIVIASGIQLYPKEYYDRGLTIVTAPTVRNLHNAINPAIKSLNYLNNILAKIEAGNAGCEEAIMLNSEGFIAECTGDNLFIMSEGKLCTPSLASGALYGITRNIVMDLARKNGIEVVETNISRYDVFVADECFLTGTGAEVVPVVKVDQRVIGDGVPGVITRKLVADYHDLTRATGDPIVKSS